LIPKSNCLISRGIGRRNNWLGYAKDYPLIWRNLQLPWEWTSSSTDWDPWP